MGDYVNDSYVHRLIQSKTDGKLVEVRCRLHADCGGVAMAGSAAAAPPLLPPLLLLPLRCPCCCPCCARTVHACRAPLHGRLRWTLTCPFPAPRYSPPLPHRCPRQRITASLGAVAGRQAAGRLPPSAAASSVTDTEGPWTQKWKKPWCSGGYCCTVCRGHVLLWQAGAMVVGDNSIKCKHRPKGGSRAELAAVAMP